MVSAGDWLQGEPRGSYRVGQQGVTQVTPVVFGSVACKEHQDLCCAGGSV